MEYTFDEITKKGRAFNNLLNNDRKYDFDLVYSVQKNRKIAQDEIDVIRESLPEDAEGFQEFHNKRFELAREYGGEAKTYPDGQSVVDQPDTEEYKEAFNELQEEYKEILEKQEKINEERNNILDTRTVDIEWFPIKKEYFPKEIEPSELPIELLDIIE